jgi:hypothetical protein
MTDLDELRLAELHDAHDGLDLWTLELVQKKVKFGHVHLPVVQLHAWARVVRLASDLLTPHQDLVDKK